MRIQFILILLSLISFLPTIGGAQTYFYPGVKLVIEGDKVRLNNFEIKKDDEKLIDETLADPHTEKFYLGSPWNGTPTDGGRFYSYPIFGQDEVTENKDEENDNNADDDYKKPQSLMKTRKAPLVIRNKEKGNIVGVFIINWKEARGKVTFHIGYAIHPNFRNQGYASSAAKAAIHWLKSNFPDATIAAKVLPMNTHSRKLLRSLGLKQNFLHNNICEYQLISDPSKK